MPTGLASSAKPLGQRKKNAAEAINISIIIKSPLSHDCCWEICYISAYCGLVGNPHLPSKISFFAPLPTSTHAVQSMAQFIRINHSSSDSKPTAPEPLEPSILRRSISDLAQARQCSCANGVPQTGSNCSSAFKGSETDPAKAKQRPPRPVLAWCPVTG